MNKSFLPSNFFFRWKGFFLQKTHMNLLIFIILYEDGVFINLLQIILSVSVSIAISEQSFKNQSLFWRICDLQWNKTVLIIQLFLALKSSKSIKIIFNNQYIQFFFKKLLIIKLLSVNFSVFAYYCLSILCVIYFAVIFKYIFLHNTHCIC